MATAVFGGSVEATGVGGGRTTAGAATRDPSGLPTDVPGIAASGAGVALSLTGDTSAGPATAATTGPPGSGPDTRATGGGGSTTAGTWGGGIGGSAGRTA